MIVYWFAVLLKVIGIATINNHLGHLYQKGISFDCMFVWWLNTQGSRLWRVRDNNAIALRSLLTNIEVTYPSSNCVLWRIIRMYTTYSQPVLDKNADTPKMPDTIMAFISQYINQTLRRTIHIIMVVLNSNSPINYGPKIRNKQRNLSRSIIFINPSTTALNFFFP